MTCKEHERRAAEALAKMANEIWGGEGYHVIEWLEGPVPSRRAALTLLADAYEQIADRDARIAADAATIERHRELAREIMDVCSAEKPGGLPCVCSLAARIAAPAEETPMTAEEALVKAGNAMGCYINGDELNAELDKLGFAVVAKGGAK